MGSSDNGGYEMMINQKRLKKWCVIWGILLGMVLTSLSASASIKPATFIFHDRTGSLQDEMPLITAAQKSNVKVSVLHARVNKQGKVKLSGQLKQGTVPIVAVEFAKQEGNYQKTATWSYQVIKKSQAKWHFKAMNLVGIGTGNMGIMNCLVKYGGSNQMPTLVKQVAIAGPFNGTHIQPNAGSKLAKNGRPYHMNMLYHELLSFKKAYPQTSRVLNIYGNQGHYSDGMVANNSSRALKYLVTPRAKSYQEQVVNGQTASHKQLTRNPQVQKAVVKFLWHK